MARQLFPDFLRDPQQYARAEEYWRRLWDETVRATGIRRPDWERPWLRTTFSDGTSFQDGDPIFSALAASLGLGVRVIQHEPEADEVELDSWVDTFGDGGQEVRVLVISCALSVEAAGYVRDLFHSWILEGEVHVVRDPEGPAKVLPPAERPVWHRPRVPA